MNDLNQVVCIDSIQVICICRYGLKSKSCEGVLPIARSCKSGCRVATVRWCWCGWRLIQSRHCICHGCWAAVVPVVGAVVTNNTAPVSGAAPVSRLQTSSVNINCKNRTGIRKSLTLTFVNTKQTPVGQLYEINRRN